VGEVAPHQSVKATITSDPVDAMIAIPIEESLRVDNTSAYVLLAALFVGGALFVLNGMRLKRRDLEALRRAERSIRRRSTPSDASDSGGYSGAGRDITGEIFIAR